VARTNAQRRPTSLRHPVRTTWTTSRSSMTSWTMRCAPTRVR